MIIAISKGPFAIAVTAGAILTATAPEAEIDFRQPTITAAELQDRLKSCLDAEDWVQTICLEALTEMDLSEVETAARAPLPAADTPVEQVVDAPVSNSEMHMIGIYESRPRRLEDGQVRLGNVPVHVDRPGETVVLVLASHETVTWTVTTTPGTRIERVIVSERNGRRSGVELGDETIPVERLTDIGLAYRNESPRFLTFYDGLLAKTGLERAASFQGAYRSPAEGFTISEAPGVATRQELNDQLFAAAQDRTTLPASMQAVLNGDTRVTARNWRFDETGFAGLDASGTVVAYRMPPDLPRVSGRAGSVAYDPDGGRLWAATYSGEGFLYEYDIRNDRWSAISMNGKDTAGLIYDPVAKRLVGTPGTLPGSPYFVFNDGSTLLSTPQISPRDYPGLIYTFDEGNGPIPSMVPLAIEGNLVLVRPDYMMRRPNQTTPSLLYLVDLERGAVELVR